MFVVCGCIYCVDNVTLIQDCLEEGQVCADNHAYFISKIVGAVGRSAAQVSILVIQQLRQSRL